jgi:hypothetical protein
LYINYSVETLSIAENLDVFELGYGNLMIFSPEDPLFGIHELYLVQQQSVTIPFSSFINGAIVVHPSRIVDSNTW